MMRELIERFGYRYRLWLAEKRGEHLGAGSTPDDESKGKIVFQHLGLLFGGIIWGIVCSQIGYTYLKCGSFQYTPQNGETQIISATPDAAAYWTVTVGTLGLGALGFAMAVYAFVCLFRACRPPAGAPQRPRVIRFMRMPKILRWFTWMCFVFGFFLPLSLIPVGGHYINEQQVTFEAFWRRGGGPIFFVAGILFPITGYGFVHAQNWSRYLFAALQIAIPVISLFFGSLDWQVLLSLAWIAFVIYYLFWLPSVREYFAV